MKSQTRNMKNLTRYDGDKTPRKGFCGWRLCFTRSKETFVRYFSDLDFGGRESSLRAALSMRSEMEEQMRRGEMSPSEVFAAHAKPRRV